MHYLSIANEIKKKDTAIVNRSQGYSMQCPALLQFYFSSSMLGILPLGFSLLVNFPHLIIKPELKTTKRFLLLRSIPVHFTNQRYMLILTRITHYALLSEKLPWVVQDMFKQELECRKMDCGSVMRDWDEFNCYQWVLLLQKANFTIKLHVLWWEPRNIRRKYKYHFTPLYCLGKSEILNTVRVSCEQMFRGILQLFYKFFFR